MSEKDLIKLLANLQGNQQIAVQEFLMLFLEISSEKFTGRTEFVIDWLNGGVGSFDYIEKKNILKADRTRRVRSAGRDN